MKNFLNYYYDLFPETVYLSEDELFFFAKGYKFYIVRCDNRDIEKNICLYNNLLLNGFIINSFFSNKDGKYLTKFKNKNIVLIKVNGIEKDELMYDDILKLRKISIGFNLERINLIEEWTKEIDMLENEFSEYNKEYIIVKDSFDYFVGCAENAIQLYKKCSNNSLDNENLSIGHFNCGVLNMKSFLNPMFLSYVDFDYEQVNYIKYKFFNNKINYEELNIIISNCKNPGILFACLLYPSYYLFLLKKLASSNNKELIQNEIVNYLNKNNSYIDFLIFFKNKLKNIKDINLIDWINR